MKNKQDPQKRTQHLRNMALDHFNDSQDLREDGDFESAEYELAVAEEYRAIYETRTEVHEK